MTITLDTQEYVRRFLTKTRWGGGPDGDCLEWTAAQNGHGYGRFTAPNRKPVNAHRTAWEWKNGPIPSGLHIDHLCKNRRCVNVAHLRLVTPRQNALENSVSVSAVNAAKTHCIHGHEFTEENTYVYQRAGRKALSRKCRACGREFDARRRASKRRARGPL